jgi:putative oxidoreductase
MAVAYFTAHQRVAFWPLENRGEAAVLFCFAFLYIAARGAGPWSVDEGIMKPQRAKML